MISLIIPPRDQISRVNKMLADEVRGPHAYACLPAYVHLIKRASKTKTKGITSTD